MSTIEEPTGVIGDVAVMTPPADRAHSPAREGWWVSHPLLVEVGFALLAAGLALIAAVLVLQLWHLDWHVPIHSGSDIQLNMGVIKNLDRHSWFYTTSDLGAPFGQQLYDYRSFSGDSFNLLVAKLIGAATDDPAVIANAFIVLSYPLVAAAAYIGARLIGLRRGVGVLVAVVFALLPFHQSRIALHLFYANYAAVPLVLAVAIRQAGPRPMLRLVRGAGWKGLMHRDSVLAGAIIVIAATSGSYFGAFSCFFMALAGALAALRHRRRAAVPAVLGVVLLGALMAAQTLPYTLYQRAHGANDITTRSLVEFDAYPLRLSQLLLPVNDHRLPLVRDWRDAIPDSVPANVEGLREPMGLLGTIGFFICLGLIAAQLTRLRRARWARRLSDAPLLMLGGVLVAIGSGLDWIVGVAGFTQVRAWNRISPFIAFLCVCVCAAALERCVRRRRVAGIVLVALVGIVAVLDQTRSADVPNYAQQAREWSLQEDAVTGIERTLGPEAAVFELPIVDYPENPTVVALPDYAELFGYLHSDSLRWSYGAVKHRNGDWQHSLDPLGNTFVDDLLITGFTGLTINRLGYEDRGSAVEAALQSAGLRPSIENEAMGGLVFYDLRPARAGLDVRQTTAQQAVRRVELLGN